MTPEEIERALGSLRHEEPVPDDVAARLDARLAELVTEREESPDEPVPAGSPRHRRWLWVAAAACVVAVAGGPLVQRLDLGGIAGSDQAATSESAPAERSGAARDLEDGPPVALTSTGFAEQARAVAAGELGAPEGGDPEGDTAGGGVGTLGAPEDGDASAAPSPRASSEVCRPPAVGGAATRFLPATYDGTPATLVLRDGVATLWACDGTRVLNEAAVTP